MATDLPHGYRPSDEEPFMNERQREYFRRKLVAWKEDILRESRETIQNLQSEPTPNADLADRATTEAERQLELRTRDRQRKLIAKIDSALRRLEDGSYGFCEETGDRALPAVPPDAPRATAALFPHAIPRRQSYLHELPQPAWLAQSVTTETGDRERELL